MSDCIQAAIARFASYESESHNPGRYSIKIPADDSFALDMASAMGGKLDPVKNGLGFLFGYRVFFDNIKAAKAFKHEVSQ